MRNFIYLSRTKVEMLHGQIDGGLFGTIKAGLKLKLGIAEASLERQVGSSNIYTQAEAVRRHLIRKKIAGPIQRPKRYVDGMVDLAFGNVREYAASIAFFGGEVDGKRVALIGSSDSIVGAAEVLNANHAPYYYTLKFIGEQLDAGREKIRHPREEKFLERAVEVAFKAMWTRPVLCTFTALVLSDSADLLVATPIFVAEEMQDISTMKRGRIYRTS